MIELGKTLFRINGVQFLIITLCMGIAIWAKYTAINLDHVSLSNFITQNFDNLFHENQQYSLSANVLMPALMYIASSVVLLWMGITNFITLSLEETKTDFSLRLLLGLSQIILFGLFLFIGGKLALYSAVFSLLVLIAVGILVSAFADSKAKG